MTLTPCHLFKVATAADKALIEYKTLHPDVRDEDIRVELPRAPAPPPDMRMPLPGGAPRFPPPPAYVQVHHAHNAHVPIAHPVMALPMPPLPAQQFNAQQFNAQPYAQPFNAQPFNAQPFNAQQFNQLLFAQGPPVLGGLGQRPLPRQDVPMMYPMPLPQQYNPLQVRPSVPYNLRAAPPIHMPPPPRPPSQHMHMAPPVPVAAIPGTGRMSGRKRRR
jgi:hypothetical protein